jgi:hypothetical protein
MSFMGYVQSLWSPAASSTPFPGGLKHSSGGFFANSTSASSTYPSVSRSSNGSAQQLGSGVWPLSPQVREEMKKGTRYNMKVILRGTKGTGKSTLLARLTGHPLPLSYTPSSDIVASTMRLQGEHCAANEGTKVDIWEVVEEGRQRSASSSSPSTTAKMVRHIPSAQLQEALRVAADARLLDVYGGAHLTIFMIDPRERASWEYAKQETLHVPPTCCVLYALNFSDTTPPASTKVSLAEVQAWCTRARRATTSVVHRMLEGRQAAGEFSVRPMTAVLSALTGAGILGVIRALHVASTLLRIAVEEVRVVRLFELMARQQAVAIGDDAAPPTFALADSSRAAGTVSNVAADTKEMNNCDHPTASISSSRSDHFVSPALQQAAQQEEQQRGKSATATAATQGGSTGLRLEHRATAPLSSTIAIGAATHDQPLRLTTRSTGAAQPRQLSEAEAMKLFLGSSSSSGSSGGGSNASDRSSRSSPSAPGFSARNGTSSIQAASMKVRGVLSTRRRPPSDAAAAAASTAVPSPSQAEVAEDDYTDGATAVSASLSPPTHHTTQEPETDVAEAAAADHSATTMASLVRLPEEEVVRFLAATMVHDAEVPAADFFGERDTAATSDKEAGVMGAAATEEPVASVERSGSVEGLLPPLSINQDVSFTESVLKGTERDDGLRARPLGTQRVARKATTTAPPTFSLHKSPQTLQADVSAILIQMAAALAADVPSPGQGGEAGRAAQQTDGGAVPAASADPAVNTSQSSNEGTVEKQKKSRSSNHHCHSRDSISGRHEQSRHRRHRERHSHSNVKPEEQAGGVEDDGRFELVLM